MTLALRGDELEIESLKSGGGEGGYNGSLIASAMQKMSCRGETQLCSLNEEQMKGEVTRK